MAQTLKKVIQNNFKKLPIKELETLCKEGKISVDEKEILDLNMTLDDKWGRVLIETKNIHYIAVNYPACTYELDQIDLPEKNNSFNSNNKNSNWRKKY